MRVEYLSEFLKLRINDTAQLSFILNSLRIHRIFYRNNNNDTFYSRENHISKLFTNIVIILRTNFRGIKIKFLPIDLQAIRESTKRERERQRNLHRDFDFFREKKKEETKETVETAD